MLFESVVIAQNGTLSAAVNVKNEGVIGVIIPPLDSCTVFIAVCSTIDGTYVRLQKEDWSGDLTTGTIAATGKAIIINSQFPFTFLKVETSAAQTTAARTFYIYGKRL